MSHDGLTSPYLSHMRRALDEVTMSDKDRRAVANAIARVEADWYTRHREAYSAALDSRDSEHQVVVSAATAFQKQVEDAAHDVRVGRRSADDVRKWLRDVYADFERLTEAHEGVTASDDRLEEFCSMSPDAYQADIFDRFAPVQAGAPTIQSIVAEAPRNRRFSRQVISLSEEGLRQIDRDEEIIRREMKR